MVAPHIIVRQSGSPDILQEIVENFSNLEVLVGVPEEKSDRPNTTITNAGLAYVHTHGIMAGPMRQFIKDKMGEGKTFGKAYKMYIREKGSPLFRVPPRPIIEPALNDSVNQQRIIAGLTEAAKAALDGDELKCKQKLQITGMRAQNIVRAWFTDPKNNWAPNAPYTIAKKGSSRPLIDTTELRKSITYVVRERT